MKLAMRVLIWMCMVLVMVGCSTVSSRKEQYSKNYTINVEKQARIRTPMIVVEYTTYIRGSRVQGVPESRDYWEPVEYPSGDSFREELVYVGRSGDTLRLSYMRKDYAWPAFYQELTYDLGKSDIVVLRNYRIRILDAADTYIRFVVVKD